MSSHVNTDAHGSAPLWALTAVKKAPTAANMGAAGTGKLFNNATANNLITGVTIGLFNLKDTETDSGKVAHAGWNMKVTGSGGRASRVQYECMVALTNSADA
jgi:hypothetical protein|tara:strand:- start:42 stop:347 length:306 start_codon:yes stop_codon:yes gene_type:complete